MAKTFDSKDNHQIVSFADSYTSPSIGFFAVYTEDITHGLGYKPNVRAYFEPNTNDIWPLTNNFWALSKDIRGSIESTDTTTSLRLENNSTATTVPFYARVYEQGDIGADLITFDSKERIEIIETETIRGSFTATSGGVITTQEVDNPLGSKAFPVLRWSEDETTWSDQDVIQYANSGSDYLVAIAHCDNSKIYIEAFNNYSTSKTVYYEVQLIRFADSNVLFDSKKSTFLNFSNDTADIVISGSIANGERREWETTVTLTDDSYGLWNVKRSDVAGIEYAFPYRPLDFVITPANLFINTQITYNGNNATVKVILLNQSGSAQTIPTTTLTYRHTLFRVS